MAKKLFGVREGYVWIDSKGVPQPDIHEVTIEEDGPEFEAQKHKLEPVEAARKHHAEREQRIAARSGRAPGNRMVASAPGSRKSGTKKGDEEQDD